MDDQTTSTPFELTPREREGERGREREREGGREREREREREGGREREREREREGNVNRYTSTKSAPGIHPLSGSKGHTAVV